MKQTRTIDTKQLVVLAMICALAYASVALFRVNVVLFLKYEPKDCLIAICGMLYGPLSALLVSVCVSLLEFVTVSDTGVVGLLMNVISTALFVLPSAILYQRKKSLHTAVIGLLIGCVSVTAGMMLWNWLITPLYMEIPRKAVEELLLPAFLPFNLLKAGLNTALTLFLYKGVVTALRKAHLVPRRETSQQTRFGGAWIIGLVALAALVLVLLVWRGIL